MRTAEVVTVLCKVFAADAKVAPLGAKTKRFKTVASGLSGTGIFSAEADSKRAWSRYEQLEKVFNKKNWKEETICRVDCSIVA